MNEKVFWGDGMFEWKKDLEIGIKQIDDQHKMLITVLNQVYEACSRGEGSVKIKEVAVFLEWYVDKHFSDEEDIQEQISYPVMEHHIKKHRMYQLQVRELLASLKSNDVTTEDMAKVVIYLQMMIKDHIIKDDKALAYYITNNKLHEEMEPAQQMQLDPLTGVLAKDEFRMFMQEKFKDRGKNKQFYIVMTIDYFGNVNRTYGYDIGEEVIIYVAGILHLYQSDKVLIGRNHQDEFVMFIDEEDKGHVDKILEDISSRVYYGFKKAGSIVPLSLSMGIVEIGEETLLKHIKQDGIIALQKAEEAGGNQRIYFEEHMYNKIIRNSQIVNQLQAYNAKDYLFVVYQPIYDVKTQGIRGYEALLRMRSGESIISPAEFIPLAEKNNLIVDVGYFCIRQVCKDMKKMLLEGTKIDYISINLSVEQIRQKDLVEQICIIATEEGIDIGKLYFELTESILVDDFINISNTIGQLKAYGCKILLDDFGSGYSALAYLSRIDTDILKIDKTLIEGIEVEEKVVHVLKHIIGLAKELGMQTVIEGVETREEKALLERLGIDKIQGYYISRPLEVENIIQKNKKQ